MQTLLWNEVDMGRASSSWHGNQELSMNSRYSLPLVLLVSYLHITWIFLLKSVGILLSEIEMWGVFSWKACSIFFMLSKLHPLATALLDSDCVWVHLPVCVCVHLLLEILCYLLGHKYCVNHNGGLSTAGISPSVEVHKTKKVLRKSSPHLETPSWPSLGFGSCLEWMICTWNNFVYSLTPWDTMPKIVLGFFFCIMLRSQWYRFLSGNGNFGCTISNFSL